MIKLKTIRGYAALARFLASVNETDRVVPRNPAIPSPYRYSPEWAVYDWNGDDVVWVETAHRKYEVFMVV